MARYGRLLTDAQRGEDPSLASETAPAPAWPQTTGQRSQGSRGASVDSAQRGSLAGLARGISFTGNVLAATSGLGRARNLAHHLARILGRSPSIAAASG